jgi:hypothetical protein
VNVPELIKCLLDRGEHLNGPSDGEQLHLVETAICAPVPRWFKEFYSEHDGMYDTKSLPGRLMPLAEILEVLSENAENREKDWTAPFPDHVLPFFATDDGNYFAEYVAGDMHQKVLHLDHEELCLVPVFRSPERLLSAALSVGLEGDLLVRADFPAVDGPAEQVAASDLRIANGLLEEYRSVEDKDATWEQAQRAMCAMALLPPAETGALFQLLRSRHPYVAEFACRQVVARRLENAVSALAEIVEAGAEGIVLMSALSGLGRLGGREAVDALIRLAPAIPEGYAPYFGGFETRRAGDEDIGGTQWVYRLRQSDEATVAEWQPLPSSFPAWLAERLRSTTSR